MYNRIIFLLLIVVACSAPDTRSNEAAGGGASEFEEVITSSYNIKKENGRILKDTLTGMQSVILDRDGREIAGIVYNVDGSVVYRDQYVYDAEDRKIGSEFYEDGKQTSYYKYKLDELGRRISFEAFDIETDNLLYDGASRYVEDGRLRQDGYVDAQGKFIYQYEYPLDPKGNELAYVYISRDGQRSIGLYINTDYDENGIWTRREILSDDKIIGIEEKEVRDYNE